MKVALLCLLLLLASALTVSVQSILHKKHGSFSRWSLNSEVKDDELPKLNKVYDSTLPTFVPIEASSPELEDEDVSKETANGGDETDEVFTVDLEMSAEDGRSIPVMLSEEMLIQLIKASEEEQHDAEEDEEDSNEYDVGKVSDADEESEEITLESKNDGEEQHQQQTVKDLEEEVGSSTGSEIPVDLDYAADSVSTETQNTKLEKNKPLAIKVEKEGKVNNELPTVMEDYDTQSSQDYDDPKDGHQEKPIDQAMDTENLQDEKILTDLETDKSNTNEDKVSMELAEKELLEKQEGDKSTNESVSHASGKHNEHEKSKRLVNAPNDQALSVEVTSEHSQNQDTEAEITLNMVQRKRGKWASLLGMNPVQIRASLDLFPRINPTARPKSRTGADPGQEASVDLCENFHCKRGKTCKLDDKKKPSCVCQQPADCPPSLSEFDQVCGTDNQTYDSSCQLFAIKCNLEGSKKGHRLHLDYTGSCKFILPCLETELVHFPLRMRDWLKNVLLQLYEQDFLTAKQRSRVQKMYENERRLHAGSHPVELLARDFEKNYNMYIYPVHWQFAQMDQHPSDRFLSHSELAPLRAPLVPMEHCTSVFFHECDADKDKLLSFMEWCKCFGIKDEDMDITLLF